MPPMSTPTPHPLCEISIWLIPQDLTGDQSTLVQIINWASLDPDLCHYMTSLRHNVLTMTINLFFLIWFTEIKAWIVNKHIYCFLYHVISHPCLHINSRFFFIAIYDFECVFCWWDVLSKWSASSHKISEHLKSYIMQAAITISCTVPIHYSTWSFPSDREQS